MSPGEKLARRAIEGAGYEVHDADVLFRAKCKNIDLVVYGASRAVYIQVKTSTKPAGKECLVLDGSPWTEEQLSGKAPIYNKHAATDPFKASFIVVVDLSNSDPRFYVCPPEPIEEALRKRGRSWAATPKRDGQQRSLAFRKELPRDELSEWEGAWHLISGAID